ncbi:MAG: type II secretion system secretin GspD [Hyphomicrobiales bacterium]
MKLFGVLFALVVVVSASCTTEDVSRSDTSSGLFGKDFGNTYRSSKKRGLSAQGREQSSVAPGSLRRGNDTFLNNEALRQRPSTAIIVPRDGQTVDVTLVNASLAAAAQAVLGDALGKQFTISDDLNGTITIQSTGPIPKAALLELFEAALSANGARLEQDGNVLKILPGTSGNKTFRLASSGSGNESSIIVAPLEFVSAGQMVNLLDPLIDEGLSVVADQKRNLLLMTGSSQQLEAALDALNLFDVDVLSGKSVALVRLNSADPNAIVDELQTIFETEEGGNLSGVLEFIPNERLGSVLIITSRSKYLPRAQRWIRELDRTATGAQKYIQTYDLENRKAADVAPILNQLLSSDAATGQTETGTTELAKANAPASGSRVAADNERNAVHVRATRGEHSEIRNLLRELDTSPQQVLLEATIAEVTLNDEMNLGVRWFFNSGNFDLTFSDVASGAVSSTFPGFSGVFGSNSADVAINALAGVTDVKIISSPTLMVLDNQEAVLQIGDQVPVAVQSSVSTNTPNAPVVTTIEYRDTGVILTVKPNINRNGRVVLDVTQEVSDVAATQTSGIDSPTIRQRKIATNVMINDGSTLALGGLIQENDTVTVSKVPGLGDVPVLGNIFRNKETVKKRSELLILIRPRVIHTDHDAKTVTEYWRTKLSSADSLLQTGLGSPKHKVRDILN